MVHLNFLLFLRDLITDKMISSWSNRILAANDFGAIQINVADVDPVSGQALKSYKTYALSGAIRAQVRFS